jgi:tetratricopeptide (TPR) repeat protein
MQKAFLSHSSFDKEYVRIVARHLGRANVLFDENNFDIGVDFRKEIVNGLGESKMFVFFASKKSISSYWCNYEIEKAELYKIRGELQKCICIIIDRDITHRDLPEWMQESKIVLQPRPALAYRDILHSLIEMIDEDKKPPYIGREDYTAKIKEVVAEIGKTRKQVFVFSGLDGIGKRQVFLHNLPQLLDLKEGPYYLLNDSSTFEDIYLMLLEDTSELFDKDIYVKELMIFRSLDGSKQIVEIAEKIISLCKDGFLPCFIDHGSLLQDNGELKHGIKQIFEIVINSGDFYICIHERRTPYFKDNFDHDRLCHFKINPLTKSDIAIILRILIKRLGKNPIDEKINEIAEYIDGYPPAVYFSAKFIDEYGLDVLIADKSMLIDFKSKRFSSFISRLTLSDEEWNILRYLITEGFMQIDVLAQSLGLSVEEIAPKVKNLIDLSLISYIDEKYGISKPIRDSVARVKGFFSNTEYDDVAKRLTSAYWKDDTSCPYLEVVDATINAVARSTKGNIEEYKSFLRPSTLKRIAQELYYQQDWETSIEYAKRGLELDDHDIEFNILIFKSYAKQEKWDAALEYLGIIQSSGHRHFYYLEGFFYKSQRKFKDAIESFRKALASGDSYFAVIRDYSDCLFRVGEYALASKHINQILREDSENIFVLDLAIRIDLEMKDYKKALVLLQQLERCDIDGRFIYSRKASYFVKLHNWNEALINIDLAIKIGLNYFEVLAEKANILIELGKMDEAEDLLKLIREKHKDQRHDVQFGLKCKLLSRQGRWREAYACWENLNEKSFPVHLSLLASIMEQKTRDYSVSLSEREAGRAELNRIKGQLKTIEEIGNFDSDDYE